MLFPYPLTIAIPALAGPTGSGTEGSKTHLAYKLWFMYSYLISRATAVPVREAIQVDEHGNSVVNKEAGRPLVGHEEHEHHKGTTRESNGSDGPVGA